VVQFSEPQVILFVDSPEESARFYGRFGFVESFRTPEVDPVKIETVHGGFTLGLATRESAAAEHGLVASNEPQRAVVVLWTDDAQAAYELALAAGAPAVQPPHVFRDSLRVAFVEDLDGHPVHLVQRIADPSVTSPVTV